MTRDMHATKASFRNSTPVKTLLNFFHLGFIQASNGIIQILVFPLIIRQTGIAEFGHIMVANSFATLMSAGINYGSNQSGVKDVALHAQNQHKLLHQHINTILFSRLLLFCIALLTIPFFSFFSGLSEKYIWAAAVIMLAEVINPLFYFIGIQTLSVFNIANLISRISGAVLIFLFVRSAESGWTANWWLALPQVPAFLLLLLYAKKKNGVRIQWPGLLPIKQFLVKNSALLGNNVSVQLQQSFFMFTLSAYGNPLVLGAYAVCDKIIWSFRMIIISFSSAVFPKAVITNQYSPDAWKEKKKQINLIFTFVFMLAAIFLYAGSDLIVRIISGRDDLLAASFISHIAPVPLIMSLNAMNVTDMLIHNHYKRIFLISVWVLSIAVLFSLLIARFAQPEYFGFYPLIVETAGLLFYLYHLRKINTLSQTNSISTDHHA